MRGGYVYALPPIDDFEGEGWREATDDDEAAAASDGWHVIATHPWFEDEGSQGPYVMRLPGDTFEPGPGHSPLLPVGVTRPNYAVAVKIVNNGTTFVWSPVELAWFKEYEALRPEDVEALDRAATRRGLQ